MSGLFALNAIAAVSIGAFTVAAIALTVFVLMTQLKAPKKFWSAVLRAAQVLALTGAIGALIMQAFGLWIT